MTSAREGTESVDRADAATGSARPDTDPSSNGRITAPLIACATLAVAFFTHLPFLNYVFADAAFHGYTSAQIWSGQLPYADLFDPKPPFTYFLLAPVDLVAPRSVIALSIVSLLLTASTALVIAFGIPIARTARQRLMLATTLALVLNAPFVEGVAYNTEQAMDLFVAGSIAVAFRARTRPEAGALAAGGLACLAVLSKQVGLVFAPIPLGILLVQGSRSRDGLRGRLKPVGLFAAGSALPGALFLAFYGFSGHLQDVWQDVVRFGFQYSRAGQPGSLLGHLPPSNQLVVFVALGLAVSAVATARWLRHRDLVTGVLLAWFLAALAGSQVSGFDFFHYYAPAVAPAVGLAVLLSLSPDGEGTRVPSRLVRYGCAFTVVVMAAMAAKDIVRPKPQPAVVDKRAAVAAFLKEHRRAGDRLHVTGYAPEIYFLTGIPSATRHLYEYRGPPYDQFHAEIEATLLARPPRFYVSTTRAPLPTARRLLDRYRPVMTRGRITVFELTDR